MLGEIWIVNYEGDFSFYNMKQCTIQKESIVWHHMVCFIIKKNMKNILRCIEFNLTLTRPRTGWGRTEEWELIPRSKSTAKCLWRNQGPENEEVGMGSIHVCVGGRGRKGLVRVAARRLEDNCQQEGRSPAPFITKVGKLFKLFLT
jgi:hypothetical protein